MNRDNAIPKVSVIIPTYNRAEVIVDAIQSVLDQTINDFEVIVVDDGSTDHTRGVIESIDDSRIRYHHQQNHGAAGARNTGLRQAVGRYIAFLDSDDFWPDKYLKTMLMALAENPDYGLAYASIVLVDNEGNITKERTPMKVCKSGWVTKDLFSTGFVSPVAALIRKEILNGFTFDESLKTAEDSDFFLRLSLKTKFLYVPEVVVPTRESDNSICAETGLNYNRLLSLERFYRLCDGKKHVPFYRAAKKLSSQYRKVAEQHRKLRHKKAALFLYRKAIRYRPFDGRLYIGWIRSLMIIEDKYESWRMPSSPIDAIQSDDLM